MTHYAIRRIDPLSAFKYGFALGALAMLPTGLLVGLFARWIVSVVRAWMESWGTLEVEALLGVGLEINLLNVVELTDFLEMLRGLDEMGFLLVVAIIFLMVVFGGIFIGLQCLLVASTYNWGAAASGGIIVHAEMLNAPASASRGWDDRAPELARQQAEGGAMGRAGNGERVTPPLTSPPSFGEAPRPVAARPLPSPPRPFAQQPQAKAWLVSSHDGRRYPIKADKTLIGSAPNNDIVVSGLAPHHAEVRLQDQRYILYDRGIKQISVNERPIMGPNMLKDGFRVRLGSLDFVFKEEV